MKIFNLLSVMFFAITSNGQNIVTSLKDKAGNLWFTVAERGVYRYDGTSFVNFTRESHKLNIQVSSCIYEDRSGNLWFNTNKGLCFYDGKKFTEFKLPFPPSTLVGAEKYAILVRNPIQVLHVLQDKNNSFWFLTLDHGVYRFDKNLSDSVNEKNVAHFLLDETPNCILETSDGDIFIGSWRGGGVYRYHKKSPSTPQEGFTNVTGFSDGMISCLVEDKSGNIWVGTRNFNVDRYNPHAKNSDTEKKSIINFSQKDGLTNRGVYCILEDSKGNLWMGSESTLHTNRGDLFFYNGQLNAEQKYFTNMTANLPLTMVAGYVYGVRSLIEDKVGNIWIGSKDGLLLCYNGKKFVDFSENLSK